MAASVIDLNRGVTIKPGPGGLLVYMYKDTPGAYINAYGNEVPEAIAAEAGYDTDTLGKLRLKRERIASAAAQIEAELAIEADEKTVEERDGYKIIDYGLGRHKLLDPEGNRLTLKPLPLEMVQKMLDTFAPLPKIVLAPPAQPPAKKPAA